MHETAVVNYNIVYGFPDVNVKTGRPIGGKHCGKENGTNGQVAVLLSRHEFLIHPYLGPKMGQCRSTKAHI
jgi:hypothetical protein